MCILGRKIRIITFGEEMVEMDRKWKYCITGGLAGLANGLFGSGGGLFLVPLFTRWTDLPERKAFATSVGVILPLSAVSAVVYFFKGAVDLSAAWPYILGGAAGGLLSGRALKKVPVKWLRRGFGALMAYCGAKAVLGL